MTTVRTPMLKIGDKVVYHGPQWGRGPTPKDIAYCNDGDVAIVIKRHEAIPAIKGWVIDHDDETGEPVYDTGIRAYVVVEFANGLTAAIDGDDLRSGRYRKVRS